MPTNPHFDFYKNVPEQKLVDDLFVESIRMFGTNIYYIPRKEVNYDPLYGSDEVATYDSHHIVEMYLKTIDGFEGDGTFLSKFNIQMRDQVTFSVAKTAWELHVGQPANLNVPKEGDLLWFPVVKRLFVIKFVNKRAIFYQLGDLQSYDLVCEFYEYSNERFNTGIEDVDKLQAKYSLDKEAFSIGDEEGNIIIDEEDNPFADEQSDEDERRPERTDSTTIQREANNIIVFDETNPFSEENY